MSLLYPPRIGMLRRIRTHRRIQLTPRLLKKPLISPRRGVEVEVLPETALPEFATWVGGGS